MFIIKGFPGGDSGKKKKNLAYKCRRHKRYRFNPWVREDPLEKGMITYSSILALRIPRTEEPAGLWFIELQRVRHN